MFPTHQGSLRLLRLFGINVWLHWSWAILAIWVLSERQHLYSSPLWNLAETIGLFAIVLMHEFGHALACRQVGGKADEIVLWPFGGVAYVQAPPRPGAQLWSIVAGPLVNVALIPVFMVLPPALIMTGVAPDSEDFWRWLYTLSLVNIVLLVFNMLPVYPLDGGQTVRSLLWFKIGPVRSLLYASGLGLVGAAALLVMAIRTQGIWLGIIVFLLGSHCWQAFKAARQAVAEGRR